MFYRKTSIFRPVMVIFAVGILNFGPVSYISKAEEVEELDPLRLKAKNNDPEAQLQLGNEYFYGSGRPQNYTLAVHWFRKAALQDCADAQYNLGVCLQYGMGIKRSGYQAFEWYAKAAKNGSKPAEFNLAMCYYHGIPAVTEGPYKTPELPEDYQHAKK